MILKFEIKSSLNKMKKNKSAISDKIVTGIMRALDGLGSNMVTEVINEIYNSGEISEDFSRSVFIVLLKKSRAIEYEPHPTISLDKPQKKINNQDINE